MTHADVGYLLEDPLGRLATIGPDGAPAFDPTMWDFTGTCMMSAMDFTVRYQPTHDEVARAFLQGFRRQLRALYLVAPSVMAVCGLLLILMDRLGAGAGLLVGAVVLPFALTWSARLTAKRALGYLCVPTTLHVTDDGYECRTEKYTSIVHWSMFTLVVTTREFWVFFAKRQCMGFLPRRAFDSHEQAELDGFFAATQGAARS